MNGKVYVRLKRPNAGGVQKNIANILLVASPRPSIPLNGNDGSHVPMEFRQWA